jgi:hypothetical protein
MNPFGLFRPTPKTIFAFSVLMHHALQTMQDQEAEGLIWRDNWAGGTDSSDNVERYFPEERGYSMDDKNELKLGATEASALTTRAPDAGGGGAGAAYNVSISRDDRLAARLARAITSRLGPEAPPVPRD